ncbi:MAG: nucleotidyl transferase AbiEii/AbiGii toxin family protein [Planctomycetes bacterium]|nr:nucleotidyl transferase AbiEii/AbiGii toxin family protein [Planctomycetota bacterium]
MHTVARLPAVDRAALFREASVRLRFGSELLLEKDFWVSWTLLRLFARPRRPAMLFKGGTSLSKCFGLIERFSEDIDLTLDRVELGFGGEQDPGRLGSRNKFQKAVERLDAAAQAHVREVLLPELRTDFAEHLQEAHTLELDIEDPSTILFTYPRAGATDTQGVAYVRPVVRMELGARSDHHPTRVAEVRPYAADAFPDLFESPSCRVVALAPERTLVEKALIFHSACAKGRVMGRASRHAYDLLRMQRAGVTKAVTRELFELVARHKLVFSDEKAASEAPRTGLQMVPQGDVRKALENDYQAMGEMFFRAPPPFEEILEGLREVEEALNALVGRLPDR